MNHLVGKGRECAMPMAQWLARWQAREVWMHSINHPKLHVLADVALHCLEVLGIQGVSEASDVVPDELAHSACWLVYPALADAMGLREGGSYHFKCARALSAHGKPVKYMGLQEFVERSLAVYVRYAPDSLVCDRLDAEAFGSLVAALAQGGNASSAPSVGNPYANLLDHRFWRRAVERVEPGLVDPVVRCRFRIAPQDKVATAGSCFAQHVWRVL